MTIQFPDVSNWQGQVDLNGWPIISAKATQGRSFVDADYAWNKAQAERLGVPFIAYHWLDTTDAAEQAAHCFATVGRGVPLMIDDEQNIVDVAHTLAFVTAYRALGGWVRLEYVPRWIWDRSGRPDLRPLADAGLLIVSSNYPAGGYTEAGPGWAAYGGVTPTVWQWTSSYPWRGQKIDMNAFRGTVADFIALLTNGGTVADMSPAIWQFIESGQRPVKPDTFTPPGYSSVPNNWLGAAVGMTQQDAARTYAAVTAGFAADTTRDAATLAAVTALTAALNAATGGGGAPLDAAPIIAAIQAAAAETRTLVTQLQADLAAAHAEAADLRHRLAQVLDAAPAPAAG